MQSKSNLDSKIKECIHIIGEINQVSFEESSVIFSKLYANFLRENRNLILEDISNDISAIDIFEECLLQQIEKYGILDENQEKFLYAMLYDNDYVEANKKFIETYYKLGMKQMIAEGIDTINYRAVLLLNEISPKGRTGKFWTGVNNYRRARGKTKATFTGTRPLRQRIAQRYGPYWTGKGPVVSFWDGMIRKKSPYTQSAFNRGKARVSAVANAAGTRLKSAGAVVAQKASVAGTKLKSAGAAVAQRASAAGTKLKTFGNNMATRARTFYNNWATRNPPPPPQPTRLTRQNAAQIVQNMGLQVPRPAPTSRVPYSDVRRMGGDVQFFIDTMFKNQPSNQPIGIDALIQKLEFYNPSIAGGSSKKFTIRDKSGQSKTVGEYYYARRNLIHLLRDAVRREDNLKAVQADKARIKRLDSQITAARAAGQSVTRLEAQKTQIEAHRNQFMQRCKKSRQAYQVLGYMLGYKNVKQLRAALTSRQADILDTSKDILESKLDHDLNLINRLKEMYGIH